MNFEEKHCPHCGALLVENASFCPYCESVLIEKHPAEMPKPKRRRRITAALLLGTLYANAGDIGGDIDSGWICQPRKGHRRAGHGAHLRNGRADIPSGAEL